MKRYPIWNLLLAIMLFMLSSITRADDSEVTAWTQQVLLATLSIDYTQTPADSAVVRANYTKNAWEGITNFLRNYMQRVRSQKLTLHPVLSGPASIVASGAINQDVLPGINYWRINQQVVISELNISIDFSIVVIMTSSSSKYLVQSLSMSLRGVN